MLTLIAEMKMALTSSEFELYFPTLAKKILRFIES